MASKVLRRSGDAVTQYFQYLGWRPDKVWMVGLGVHYQEVYVMREAWPNVEITAYEPHPLNVQAAQRDQAIFDLLQEGKLDTTRIAEKLKVEHKLVIGVMHATNRIWGQKGPNVRVEQTAIANVTGKTILYAKPKWKDGGTLLSRTEEGQESIMVDVDRLDNRLRGEGCVNGLLWMDCEGSELAALQGGEKLLKKSVKALNVEMTGCPAGPDWPSPVKVWDFLVMRGFFHVWTHSIRTHIGQFDSIYVRHDLFNPQLCANPASIKEWEEWKRKSGMQNTTENIGMT